VVEVVLVSHRCFSVDLGDGGWNREELAAARRHWSLSPVKTKIVSPSSWHNQEGGLGPR
jgi:hypothetical protein